MRLYESSEGVNMTDNVYNREDVLEKYREAGRILKIVRAEAVDMIKIGNSLLEVAEFVERKTIELEADLLFHAISQETMKLPMQPQKQEIRTSSGKIW